MASASRSRRLAYRRRPSRGRTCQARISSRHSSVILEIVSCDTSIPIARWQCRAISRTLIPKVILSFRVSRGGDLRCPVVDSVADGTLAA